MAMSIDDWMHATNEEREHAQKDWIINNGDGQDIANHVASIFTKECVYDVAETRASTKDGQWVIETFSDDENYETLKVRKNINFLGFDVVFNHINEL